MIVFCDKLTDAYKQDILRLLLEADNEFTPHLSLRKSANTWLDLNNEPNIEDYFNSLLKQNFILYIENGNILGFLAYSLHEHKKNCYVNTIIVTKTVRDKGIATKLLNKLFLIKNKTFIINISSNNKSGRNLCEKLGFKKDNILKDDRYLGIDTICYSKIN